MTVLDPARFTLHLPDIDSSAAADAARSSFDRVSEFAREAAEGLEIDRHLDEAGQRVRAAVQTTAIRAAIARLERELPESERDRYTRAYLRGRAQSRSIYLTIGIAAGIGAGVAAAMLLEPKNGKARREAIKARARALADRSTHTIRDAVRREGDFAPKEAAAEQGADAVAAVEAIEPSPPVVSEA
jgi:hypothetical protein